ncbi:hypothetical protein [Streptomyces sp. KR55]
MLDCELPDVDMVISQPFRPADLTPDRIRRAAPEAVDLHCT